MVATRWIAVTLTGLLFIFGCGSGDPTTPPSDWEATETRWWHEDVDTSEVFQDLEDLTAMGIVDEEEMALSQGGNVTQEQFNNAIKQSLVALYRNDPETVDSLFEEYAAPKLQEADLSGDVVQSNGEIDAKLLQKYKKTAYDAINEHYREPQNQEGVSGLEYPDSLRTEETSGEVVLQAHVNTDGQVDAVEVVQSVHPTLDAIAMRASTQTTWEPAYVLRDGEWEPKGSWVRSTVPYRIP